MDMQGLENTVAIDAGNDTDNQIEVVTDKGEDPCQNPEPDDGATSAKDVSFPFATTITHFDTGGELEIGQYSESDDDALHAEGITCPLSTHMRTRTEEGDSEIGAKDADEGAATEGGDLEDTDAINTGSNKDKDHESEPSKIGRGKKVLPG